MCVIPNGIDVPTPAAGDYLDWEVLGRAKRREGEAPAEPRSCGEASAQRELRPPELAASGALRQSQELSHLMGRKVLLYLGRLHPKKGLPALLQAWAETKRSTREDWTLAIAGWDQGNHERQLAGLIADLAIDDTVLLIGPQFDKSKDACFRLADGFILPSVSEGLPMVVLEAWSYGLPVIMTPECNLPEGFQADAAMRIETPKESIRCGLERFFRLPEKERQRMGNNGLELVKQRYSWASAAKQMRSVYEWAIRGGPTPNCVVTN